MKIRSQLCSSRRGGRSRCSRGDHGAPLVAARGLRARLLERVSALRLALDTRLDATTRPCRSLAGSSDSTCLAAAALRERFDRLSIPTRNWRVGLRGPRASVRASTAPAWRRFRRRATPDDGRGPLFRLHDSGGTWSPTSRCPSCAPMRAGLDLRRITHSLAHFLRSTRSRALHPHPERPSWIIMRARHRISGLQAVRSRRPRADGRSTRAAAHILVRRQTFYSSFAARAPPAGLLARVPRDEVDASLRDSTRRDGRRRRRHRARRRPVAVFIAFAASVRSPAVAGGAQVATPDTPRD